MIIPGIFETDFEIIKKQIKEMEGVAQIVQIDIDDGLIDNGLTFLDYERFNEIQTKLQYDLHLMVAHPIKFLEKPITNVVKVCTHVEAYDDIWEFLKKGKSIGYKVGLSIHLDSEPESWMKYVETCDFIQFMGVIPGAQGRKFDTTVLEKIEEFKKVFPGKPTQIDGGINENTIHDVLKSGINDIVIGSQIFKSNDPKKSFNKFKEIYEKTLR